MLTLPRLQFEKKVGPISELIRQVDINHGDYGMFAYTFGRYDLPWNTLVYDLVWVIRPTAENLLPIIRREL